MPKKTETQPATGVRTSARLATKKSDLPPAKTITKEPKPKKEKKAAKDATTDKQDAATSFYALSALDINNNNVDFKDFTGKVVLVVNVASKCGHTKANYEQLEPLYKQYAAQGFEVLAFPCGQFGSQEFGTNEEICEFVKGYNVSFKLFDKVKVKGAQVHPVFKYLKSAVPGEIKWNFAKYLIDKKGVPYKFYDSKINPSAIEEDIKTLLAQ